MQKGKIRGRPAIPGDQRHGLGREAWRWIKINSWANVGNVLCLIFGASLVTVGVAVIVGVTPLDGPDAVCSGSVAVLFGLIFTGFGFWATGKLFSSSIRCARISLAGGRSEGVVTAVDRGAETHDIVYKFTDAQGNDHLGLMQMVDHRTLCRFVEGDRVEVYYDPREPYRNCILIAGYLPSNSAMTEMARRDPDDYKPLPAKTIAKPRQVDRPPYSRITISREGSSQVTALIPGSGFRSAPARAFVAIAVIFVIASIILIELSYEYRSTSRGVALALSVIPVAFVVVAAFLLWGQTQVTMTIDNLHLRRSIFGITRRSSYPLHSFQDVLSVEIAVAYSLNDKLVCAVAVAIRGRSQPVLFGSTLSAEEQEWLAWEFYDFWQSAWKKQCTQCFPSAPGRVYCPHEDRSV